MGDKRVFHTLDGMRGVAALAVAVSHIHVVFGNRHVAPTAALAVDLFFLMSGFVLAHAYSGRLERGLRPGAFMLARIIRLAPLYLLGTATVWGLALAAYLAGNDTSVDWVRFAATSAFSFAGVPTPPAVSIMPTALYPLNGPAWSLFFELAVNLAWCLAFVFIRRHLGVLLLVAAICLTAVVVASGTVVVGQAWMSFPLGFVRVTFPFFAGVAAYRVWEIMKTRRVAAGWALVLGAFALLLLFATNPPPAVTPVLHLFCVLVAFPALVYASASFEPPPGWLATSCKALGAASYPAYVLHQPIIFVLDRLWSRFAPGPAGPVAGTVVLVGFAAVLLVVSLLAYDLYDKRARRWLTVQASRFRPNAAAPA